ncbi:head GIN domain-containing protein [Mucilaginibacter aquaedulcis]|uniref:head GIN domain-containing protein n=1 Tax=Mucilaginibacter aquaedulcis TaxID=1187081 RepID=UPI0025B59FEE|nr:head GIN domain-containing protein [Mucilaginibacter aquaedulcis]MDN3548201.1 head GIN domain-containing protein [Mucilaginibacter aquaedulcis]
MTQTTTASATEPVISKTYPETGFTSIANKIDGNITFTQENSYSIVVSAQQFILDILNVQVTNSQLIISYVSQAPPHLPVSITISSPELSGISLFGSGNFNSAQAIQANDLNLQQSGSGNISLASFTGQSLEAQTSGSGNLSINAGSVSSQDLNISGLGKMLLPAVTSEQATAKISGTGTIKINVTQTLNAKISGAGDIYYSGNPTVTQKVTGSGKVIHVQ